MKYDFPVETYETEQVKVLSVWSKFKDEDLPVRLQHSDPRGRSVQRADGASMRERGLLVSEYVGHRSRCSSSSRRGNSHRVHRFETRIQRSFSLERQMIEGIVSPL